MKGKLSRRRLLRGAGAMGAITVAEWLGFFSRVGIPGTDKAWRLAQARAQEDEGDGGELEPRFLIYWFLEGGWDSYALFTAADTANHSALDIPPGTLYPTPAWSDQVYRVAGYGSGDYPRPQTASGIRYGYLAAPGADLLGDMTVISSHYGNAFHSGGRFEYHYGKYPVSLSDYRQPDERTVLQAFCEARGAGFLLPHLAWHYWLSDGELAMPLYPEGTGYYEKLGPPHAHTVYARTPEYFRQRLLAIGDVATQARSQLIGRYSENIYQSFLTDRSGQNVAAFNSALQIYKSMTGAELTVNPAELFTDPTLKEAFDIAPADEATTATSVNGNPARSKNSPHIKVQAMMALECMKNKLACGFHLESRDVRGFDSHRSRETVMTWDTNSDQLALIKEQLWSPLRVFTQQLKATECPGLPGRSLWDQTTIVIASEMGRTMFGEVDSILTGPALDGQKYIQIMEQDVCQHWPVSAVAFMGGGVQGGRQFGAVGSQSLDAIPILPDGSLDPAYDPATGLVRSGASPHPDAFVTDCGHVYSTALRLAGVDPTGKGRNQRGELSFV